MAQVIPDQQDFINQVARSQDEGRIWSGRR